MVLSKYPFYTKLKKLSLGYSVRHESEEGRLADFKTLLSDEDWEFLGPELQNHTDVGVALPPNLQEIYLAVDNFSLRSTARAGYIRLTHHIFPPELAMNITSLNLSMTYFDYCYPELADGPGAASFHSVLKLRIVLNQGAGCQQITEIAKRFPNVRDLICDTAWCSDGYTIGCVPYRDIPRMSQLRRLLVPLPRARIIDYGCRTNKYLNFPRWRLEEVISDWMEGGAYWLEQAGFTDQGEGNAAYVLICDITGGRDFKWKRGPVHLKWDRADDILEDLNNNIESLFGTEEEYRDLPPQQKDMEPFRFPQL